MELTEQTLPTIMRLARLTDQDIARIALNAAEAAHRALVADEVVIGANGNPNALHMRTGRSVNDEFDQWGERTLENGHEFAPNTGQDGKAGTAAKYEEDSVQAADWYGDDIPEGPGRWRGGRFTEVRKSVPDGLETLDGAVAASSGAQGAIDEISAATAATTTASLVVLRDEAQALLTEAGLAWADEPAPDTTEPAGTVPAGEPGERTVRA